MFSRNPPISARQAGMWIALLCALFTSLSGNGSKLPLDEHEIYVARTAEEMLERSDWLVPSFNGEVRLQKPPLCYWLVMIVDRINGADGRISEIEARVPSIVAGLTMVVMSWMLGTMLFGGACGFFAAMLLAASSGFVDYTHSARPEMVYAALCTAGIVCFARAIGVGSFSGQMLEVGGQAADVQLSPQFQGSRTHAYLGWAALGLAMLAKGPQLPLLIVVGFLGAIFAESTLPRLALIRRLCIPFGLILAGVISLWWYAAIWLVVPNALDIWHRETLERIVAQDSISQYFNPYYIYRTAELVLPWVLLFILAMASPVLEPTQHSTRLKFLWWVVIIPLILLHVSLGRRWYYMLPLIAPLTVMMAHSTLLVCGDMLQRGKTVLLNALAATHAILLVCWIIGLRIAESSDAKPPAVLVILVVLGGAGGVAVILCRRSASAVRPILAAPLLVAVLFFMTASANASLWRHQRLDRRSFSRAVAQLIDTRHPLIGIGSQWQSEQYYMSRNITFVELASDLDNAMGDRSTAYLLTRYPVEAVHPLQSLHGLKADLLLRSSQAAEDELLELWRITRE